MHIFRRRNRRHLKREFYAEKPFEKLTTDVTQFKVCNEKVYLSHVMGMSRKENYMDNGVMENFFGRLKVEMFYGEKFESVTAFIDELKKYIDYYNNERISMKLKGMSPVQYRTHSQAS